MNTVCAKRLANMGHAVLGAVWLSVLSSKLGSDFFFRTYVVSLTTNFPNMW